MLSLDVLRISSRSFRNNRLRTMLTVIGISIGIGTIFFLVSLGYGFQKIILEKIANADSLLSLDVTQENEAISLNQKSIESIEKIEGVSNVYPLVSRDSRISSNEFATYAKVNIINPEFFSLEGIEVKNGNLFEEGENDKVVISSATLQLLDIGDDDFNGKQIKIKIEEKVAKNNQINSNSEDIKYIEEAYNIAGVIDDSTKAYLYISDSSVSDLVFENYDKLKIKVDSADNLENTRNKIIEKGFFVSSVSETVEQASQIFSIARIILALFGIVALVVSAIGMFNTMTITLLERTQEIGIMKAIGASAYDIWKMFLAESMMIGFFGGIFGVFLGYIFSEVLNFFINWLAGMFGGADVDLFLIQPWFVIFIISFSTIIGIVTGFYPAKRAAKLNALEALRYK